MINFYILSLIFIALICLFLSMFFSGCENSFIQLNKFKIKNLIYRNKKVGKEIYKIMSDIDLFLSTILVGNNLAIFGFTSATLLITLNSGLEKSHATTINMIFSTIIILLFAEISPKNISRERSHYISYKTYPLLKFFQKLFFPLTYPISLLIKLFYKIFNVKKENQLGEINKKEIYSLIKFSGMKGLFPNIDNKIIERIFNFKNKKIFDAIIPSNEINPISEKSNIDNVKNIFGEIEKKYIPIYRGQKGNLVGYTTATDLLNIKNSKMEIKEIMRDLIYIPEFITLFDIIKYFEEEIVLGVIDEYGIISGLITLEDVVDEILGEEENIFYKKISTNTEKGKFEKFDEIVVSGKTPLEQLELEFGISIDESEIKTLSGFLLKKFKKIPSKNRVLNYKNYRFEILNKTKTKINKVKISYINK